jgi:hypothetical protein
MQDGVYERSSECLRSVIQIVIGVRASWWVARWPGAIRPVRAGFRRQCRPRRWYWIPRRRCIACRGEDALKLGDRLGQFLGCEQVKLSRVLILDRRSVRPGLAFIEHEQGQFRDLLLGPCQEGGDLAEHVVAGELVKPLGVPALRSRQEIT